MLDLLSLISSLVKLYNENAFGENLIYCNKVSLSFENSFMSYVHYVNIIVSIFTGIYFLMLSPYA